MSDTGLELTMERVRVLVTNAPKFIVNFICHDNHQMAQFGVAREWDEAIGYAADAARKFRAHGCATRVVCRDPAPDHNMSVVYAAVWLDSVDKRIGQIVITDVSTDGPCDVPNNHIEWCVRESLKRAS